MSVESRREVGVYRLGDLHRCSTSCCSLSDRFQQG
jgi:hypothetical protein